MRNVLVRIVKRIEVNLKVTLLHLLNASRLQRHAITKLESVHSINTVSKHDEIVPDPIKNNDK